jgi:hypothetical protein
LFLLYKRFGRFLLFVIVLLMPPARYYIKYKFLRVPLGTHSLSLDTCIYILKVCLNDRFDRVWSAFFVSAIYVFTWVMASGDSTSRVTKTTLPSQTDIHLVLYYLEGKTSAPAPCLYLKMEEIVAQPLVLGCVLQRSACLLCR